MKQYPDTHLTLKHRLKQVERKVETALGPLDIQKNEAFHKFEVMCY